MSKYFSKDNVFEQDLKRTRITETSTLTVAQYQEAAARTLLPRPEVPIADNDIMIVWNAIGLAGEGGEIASLVLDTPHLKKKVSVELGDATWYIAAIATKLNLSLDRIVRLAGQRPFLHIPAETTALRLFIHTGKVCDLVKKAVFHRHGLDIEEIEKELVNCMTMIMGLAGKYGLALHSTIMSDNLIKLDVRYKKTFTSEESISRIE